MESGKSRLIISLMLVAGLVGSVLRYMYAELQISPALKDIIAEREAELAEVEDRLDELELMLCNYSSLMEDHVCLVAQLDNLTEEYMHLESERAKLEYSINLIKYSMEHNQYPLPLAPSLIDNLDSFTARMTLNTNAVNTLLDNGFVVVEYPTIVDDFEQAYEWNFDRHLPSFITSDTMLHLYHIQFDETLKSVEENYFYDYLWNMSQALFNYSIESINITEDTTQEAHRRNAAYYAVALSLLKPKESQIREYEAWEVVKDFTEEDLERYNFTVPNNIASLVEVELGLIHDSTGLSFSPIFVYTEDYTQYRPRGHYTDTEKLKNYFKAFMWYSRLSMLLNGNPDLEPGQTISQMNESTGIISEYDAEVQTRQACLTSAYMQENPELWTIWNKVYAITSFYVGTSDDLGPIEYVEAMESIFGPGYQPDLLTVDNIMELKQTLAEYRSPAIYGGTGTIFMNRTSPESLDELLESTKGFRMMGQRYIPDSYMFQELVYPSVGGYQGSGDPFTLEAGTRGFPRGLDVMAVLGSQLAQDILDAEGDTDYADYDVQFAKLQSEFFNLTEEDWGKNLYWSWLYTLKPLLTEYDAEYPSFMQNEVWKHKQLNAVLASWTELRHDTILYAKQSYSALGAIMETHDARGYVEPVPEFYNRLLNLTNKTRIQLEAWEIIDEKASSRLTHLESILKRLLEISNKELAGEELNSDDYEYISRFQGQVKAIITEINIDDVSTPLVADVHTETNSRQVLEEGTGNLRMIIVAVKHPDGSIILTSGPVMTYYEFKHPMSDRLTDEAWKQKLADNPPDEPEWVNLYTVLQ